MKETRVIGINMLDKKSDSIAVRQILSECDPSVRTSEGLVEVTNDHEGFMMIRLKGDALEMDKIENKISSVTGSNVERLSMKDYF
jgi:hypothetical protein